MSAIVPVETGSPAARWERAVGRLVLNAPLPGKRLWYAVVALPAAAPAPEAGQFYMASPSAPGGILLARPMSVARAWRQRGELRLGFLYGAVGSGTRALAAEQRAWSLLGPLGRGFPRVAEGPRVLVAGGRGVAPLVLLAEECAARGEPVVFLNGARTVDELVLPEELQASAPAPGSLVRESTEDGSRGARGRVLDLLDEPAVRERLEGGSPTFFSCGPHGLLEAVGAEGLRRGRPAWVALEAHMACGTGICRSCVVPRAREAPLPPGAQNREFLLSCIEGPVVEASSVDWDRTP